MHYSTTCLLCEWGLFSVILSFKFFFITRPQYCYLMPSPRFFFFFSSSMAGMRATCDTGAWGLLLASFLITPGTIFKTLFGHARWCNNKRQWPFERCFVAFLLFAVFCETPVNSTVSPCLLFASCLENCTRWYAHIKPQFGLILFVVVSTLDLSWVLCDGMYFAFCLASEDRCHHGCIARYFVPFDVLGEWTRSELVVEHMVSPVKSRVHHCSTWIWCNNACGCLLCD